MSAPVEMDEVEYHAHPALSQSMAKLLLPPHCPALFKWRTENPQPNKAAFDFGHAAHSLVLGKGLDVVVVEADNWMTKVAKAVRDEAYAANKVPLLAKDWQTVQEMAAALRANPVADRLLSKGAAEQSVFWTDERGIDRRARFDYIADTAAPVIIDYKSTVSASPQEFPKSVYNFRYHMQAAYYIEAAEAVGMPDAAFAFVAQEKTPPYLVGIYELDDEALDAGKRLISKALDIYQRCTETGDWPGYSPNIELLSLPRWATRNEEA